jgi:hypothetical protein
MDIPDNPLTDELRSLNDAYIFKVNAAAEHEQWDLVQELTDEYLKEVQQVITDRTPL